MKTTWHNVSVLRLHISRIRPAWPAMTTTPTSRMQVINKSCRCCHCSCYPLLPLLSSSKASPATPSPSADGKPQCRSHICICLSLCVCVCVCRNQVKFFNSLWVGEEWPGEELHMEIIKCPTGHRLPDWQLQPAAAPCDKWQINARSLNVFVVWP